MLRCPHRPRHAKGFTLIELLIVIAILGIIASMLIPNLLDALQKAKQKRSVAEMTLTGGALFSWMTDQVGAAAAGAVATEIDISLYPPIGQDELRGLLIPQYIQTIPELDGWKMDYLYFVNTADPLAVNVVAIGSGGRDKTFDGGTYASGGFDPTDYDQDLVWADGFWVRWPGK